jgi:hypothetical protein
MKGVVDRLALFFTAGWQWLTAAPRYRGALLCGLSAIGAMIAIGYTGRANFAPPPVTQANDVVAARISAMSNHLPDARGKLNANDADNTRSADRIGDAEMVESSPENHDSRKEGSSAKAIALDKSFLVADAEKQKATIRDEDEVEKPAKRSANKPRRRVSSERDRKFDPSREITRTGEEITRVLRDIF